MVLVRELASGRRVLVAYDPVTGRTRRLAQLARGDNRPTVDAGGSQVVVETMQPGLSSAPWISGPGWDQSAHLTLIDLASRTREALTPATVGVFDLRPAWNRAGDGWVYFLRLHAEGEAGGQLGRLLRVDPRTEEVQRVPHGDGISQFTLEPGGTTAWVYADWCTAEGACGGAWQLDLRTGAVTPHTFQLWSGGEVSWAPDDTSLAYSQNGGGVAGSASLLVERWPSGSARTVLDRTSRRGATVVRWSEFGEVGWLPDGRHVALQESRLSSPSENLGAVEEWRILAQRVLIVDPVDGTATAIGSSSVRDLAFDVWEPQGPE